MNQVAVKEKQEVIIMGIDPGTVVMGYGVIKCVGNQIELLCLGSIHLDNTDNHQLRLKRIYDRLSGMIEEYLPDEMAIEAQFFGKNVQSMLKLGRAQGVCITAAMNRDIPVVEYAPKKIKQSITGNGNASKEQVAGMLQTLCKFTDLPKYLDATDALAIAVCHHFQRNSKVPSAKGKKAWEQFLKSNPERIYKK